MLAFLLAVQQADIPSPQTATRLGPVVHTSSGNNIAVKLYITYLFYKFHYINNNNNACSNNIQ